MLHRTGEPAFYVKLRRGGVMGSGPAARLAARAATWPSSSVGAGVGAGAASSSRAAGAASSAGPTAAEVLSSPSQTRLHRAIGVVYKPNTERWSHYFDCRVGDQYDAIIHTDETRAVEPLERTARWVGGEEETFPEGL